MLAGGTVPALHAVEVAALLRRLTARLIRTDDLDEALAGLVETAADLVDDGTRCSVTLVRAGGPTTAAVSSGLPVALLDSQYASGDGPSMAAVRSRDLVICDDLRSDPRWPQWRPTALAAGVRGVLAVPIDIDEHAVGALTVYASNSGRCPPDVGLAAMLVAEHAGLLLAEVLARGRHADRNAELADALGAGESVNRAVGIMMVQRSCSASDALEVLRVSAGRLGLPLSAVAQRLVQTVEERAQTVSVQLSR